MKRIIYFVSILSITAILIYLLIYHIKIIETLVGVTGILTFAWLMWMLSGRLSGDIKMKDHDF